MGRLPGVGSDLGEGVEELLYAEIVDRAAEEDRRQLALEIGIDVKGIVGALDQLRVLAKLDCVIAELLVQDRIAQAFDGEYVVGNGHAAGTEQVEAVVVKIVNALEGRAHADGPREGLDMDVQFCFELVQEFEGVLALAVELVHEDDDRRIAHAANLHQSFGLLFDALDAVDDEDDAVHCRERAVRVLGEILMARRVQQVDLEPVVIEAHDRGGDRDAALPLDVHEVRGSALADLVRLHRAGNLDRAAEEQKFFGERGLARVRMADDGEGAPLAYFVRVVHDFVFCKPCNITI